MTINNNIQFDNNNNDNIFETFYLIDNRDIDGTLRR